jgi:RecB family endonuclease NucS
MAQRRCGDCDNCCAQDNSPVAPGQYYTTVNLHNPASKPVAWRFKVALTERAGNSGYISRLYDRRLGPDEAAEIDCDAVTKLVDLSGRLHDGFLVIESDAELDIVDVLTAAGQTGKVETLSTERIPARRQP